MDSPKFTKGSQLFDSNYIVRNYIASGGMNSEVYAVLLKGDTTNKVYAAKIITKPDNESEKFWRKFADEEVTAFRVTNKPNLVNTYETFSYKDEKQDVKVFIMDYVEGVSLKEYIYKQGCLTPKVALTIFLKICNGIKALHDFKHQIIHRDLKPENIMLSYDLTKVTIMDFGISSVIQTSLNRDEKENVKYLTDENQMFGTAPYIIPDFLNNNRKATVQYDFFSLGVILHEMIMGQRPFHDEDMPSTTSQRRIIGLATQYDMYNISANPSIPVALENLIFRLIASKREDLHFRYNSIDEIITDTKNVMLLLNKKDDTTVLLKPANKRIYRTGERFPIDRFKSELPLYKRWSFFIIVVACGIVILLTALLVFFII